ncbi:hypothetical protein GCM10022212_33510 [Actimicrobium antarcticum]|uniref:FtsK gamma domain-containing protein n=1 Tax=Actimicrobium antarcticum TaxID=1051899 RepID=A0ABP7TVR7_9BURK
MKALDSTDTHRARIAGHINAAPGLLKAIDISNAVGIGYKTTVDALNNLLQTGRVVRHGAKSGTRWSRAIIPADEAPLRVEDFWHGQRVAPTPGGSAASRYLPSKTPHIGQTLKHWGIMHENS